MAIIDLKYISFTCNQILKKPKSIFNFQNFLSKYFFLSFYIYSQCTSTLGKAFVCVARGETLSFWHFISFISAVLHLGAVSFLFIFFCGRGNGRSVQWHSLCFFYPDSLFLTDFPRPKLLLLNLMLECLFKFSSPIVCISNLVLSFTFGLYFPLVSQRNQSATGTCVHW